MSLQVEQVSRLYGSRKALDRVSFSIGETGVVGLLGPNGAGKSTLMKIICCYLPPTSGRVSVCGLDTRTDSLEIRSRIGYLPEHNPLYLDMYVREYLDFVGGIYMDASRVAARREEAIARVGLGRDATKKIGELSKGYRQRLGLAQALIHDPRVLVLDEPTSGLDPNQIEEVRELIRELGRQKTVILSTHIMQEAEAVCDRIVLLNRGRLAADAPTRDLMRNLHGNVLVRVEFDRPAAVEELRAIEGVQEVFLSGDSRYELRSSSSTDLRPLLFRFAVEKGFSVLTLQQEEINLESVFHQLTKDGDVR